MTELYLVLDLAKQNAYIEQQDKDEGSIEMETDLISDISTPLLELPSPECEQEVEQVREPTQFDIELVQSTHE